MIRKFQCISDQQIGKININFEANTLWLVNIRFHLHHCFIFIDNNAARQSIMNGLNDIGIVVPASAIDGATIMMGGNSSNGLDITAPSTSEDDVVDRTVQEIPPKTK